MFGKTQYGAIGVLFYRYLHSAVLVLLYLAYHPLVKGQPVYLSFNNVRLPSNNSELQIQSIGEDITQSSLTCHTDLVDCCRAGDTGTVGMGEWYYPSGDQVPNRGAGMPFYRIRNAAHLIRLAKRERVNPSGPTGTYCCVIPSSVGELTYCISLVYCLSLPNDDLVYSDPTLGEGTVVMARCAPGLAPSGSQVCQADGTWTQSSLTCEAACLDLPQPQNGNLGYDNGVTDARPLVTRATYSCDGTIRTCGPGRAWSGSPPDCAFPVCQDVPALGNGTVQYSNGSVDDRPLGSTSTYSCELGFTLVGGPVRACQVDMSWGGPVPICIVTTCGDVDLILNGSVRYSSGAGGVRPVGSTASYVCDPGYTLTGLEERTCVIDGSWSNSAPVCKETTCEDLTIPVNGVLSYDTGSTDNRPVGTVAAFSCSSGFTLHGNSSLSCTTSGGWSGAGPVCNVTTCPELVVPVSGSIVYSNTSRTIGTGALYSCDPEHTLEGDSLTHCQPNATWSSPPPTCTETTCSDHPPVAHGAVTYSNGSVNSRPVNSEARFSCDPGYDLTGVTMNTCSPTRHWNADPPQCIVIDCGALSPPVKGTVDVNSSVYNSTAHYSCVFGYYLHGPSTRTCLDTGKWSLFTPSCEPDWDKLLGQNVTEENFASIAGIIALFGQASLRDRELQTTHSQSLLSGVLLRMALLIGSSNIKIGESIVLDIGMSLNSLLLWQPETLVVEHSSSIVGSVEVVLTEFAQQSNISVDHGELAFKARLIMSNIEGLQAVGDKAYFMENGAISLPGGVFNQIPDEDSVGILYTSYDSPNLFPVTQEVVENSTSRTIVATPVISAIVGRRLSISNVYPPVIIELELQELQSYEDEQLFEGEVRCVSWNFTNRTWVTDGCTTNRNGSNVQCQCSHLTNFAVLIDICSRAQDCVNNDEVERVLSVVTYAGVLLSCLGLLITVITLLAFKELRRRDNTVHNVQLCTAIFCELVVFAAGIEQTEPYAGCVVVSVLIHYFTLVVVMWMAAQAVLMFQKLVIIFGEFTQTYFITVSLICWLLPWLPVLLTLIVDMTNGTDLDTDLIVTRRYMMDSITNSTEISGFCFLKNPTVFFSAFLGPIFVIILFNLVIFVWVTVVVLRSTKGRLERSNEKISRSTIIRLILSLTGIILLFGLNWLFAAFTFTIGESEVLRYVFQSLFAVCASFQGFLFFIFFCVLDKKVRDAWKNTFLGRKKSTIYTMNGHNGKSNSTKRTTHITSFTSSEVPFNISIKAPKI